MLYFRRLLTSAILGSYCSFLFGAPVVVAPTITVGSNLQVAVSVSLSEAAPEGGVEITLLSSDPNRLRFATKQDQPGTASLSLNVRQGSRASSEFWAQGLGSIGPVSYTATTASGAITGTANITPSAIAIIGPMKASKFLTTRASTPTAIRLSAVRLDSDLKVAEEQFIAGGITARVDVLNSNVKLGTLTPAHLEIPGGTNTVTTQFQPSVEGDATLSLKVPPGFTIPAEFASVTAMIKVPGLGLTNGLLIGRNLEVRGILALGAAAPAENLKVTLTSDDPSKLLLSATAAAAGTRSITVTVPAGTPWSPYYLQALDSSGSVKYTASAPGYRAGEATVAMAPSGVVLTPVFQGPPDEAQVLSKEPGDGTYKFVTMLSKPKSTNLVAWTVQLDPVTLRSADITVQPLRGGLSLDVPLTNSNPSVGTIAQALTIAGGEEHSMAPFTPVGIGSTEITVTTPKDFSVSANSTKVIATVVK